MDVGKFRPFNLLCRLEGTIHKKKAHKVGLIVLSTSLVDRCIHKKKAHKVGLIVLSTSSRYCLSQIANIDSTDGRGNQTHGKQNDGDKKGEKHEEIQRL